jgi:hypothetical protein
MVLCPVEMSEFVEIRCKVTLPALAWVHAKVTPKHPMFMRVIVLFHAMNLHAGNWNVKPTCRLRSVKCS